MDPVKFTKSKEKYSTKGHEDQNARIQGLEKSMISVTAAFRNAWTKVTPDLIGCLKK